MIQLINCNRDDMRAYYNGTTLIHHGSPVNVEDVVSKTTLTVYDGSRNLAVTRNELRVHFFTPFFTDDGCYVGTLAARSYKRAPFYDPSLFRYLKELLDTGTLKSTFDGQAGRLGTQFYCTSDGVVMYCEEYVGVHRDGLLVVKDSCVYERLKLLIAKEGLVYDVVQFDNRSAA